jgi:ribosomal protein L40E
MPSEGKRQLLPCSHVGEAVFGHFYVCTVKGCDGLAAPGKCHKCGSSDLYPFTAEHWPPNSTACRKCGAVRWSY